MYLWRKRVTPDWLRLRGEHLDHRFGAALAIVERPESRQSLLQISCPTLKQALALVREMGGSAQKLPKAWLQDFAKQSRIKPLRIGSRLIVRSARGPKGVPSSARTIIIPAEAAFGTGEHATTAMCLRLLERSTRQRPPGWSMLDAGTGSGILAIAGRCLGAARALAIDNDAVACAIANRNARANGIRNIEFRASDVLKLKLTKKFDVITANLYCEILTTALPRWSRRLVPGGFLILSGILRSQERAVVAALRLNGFAIQEVRRRGKWVALRAERGRRSAPSLPSKNS